MSRIRPTRSEQMALATAALGAVVSGAVRSLTAWLLNQIFG
ncbi:hypothetical protein [Streptomyces sp. R35]|uniref:Uncharacterized protein n=1 Tax=Streptomyces sp. R35 TaxID=3238630 RepID=A0AB39SR02_9ACTN